jgi:hypothetical protein
MSRLTCGTYKKTSTYILGSCVMIILLVALKISCKMSPYNYGHYGCKWWENDKILIKCDEQNAANLLPSAGCSMIVTIPRLFRNYPMAIPQLCF